MLSLIRIAMVIESLHNNKNSNTIINHLKPYKFKDETCFHLEETSALYLSMFSVLVFSPIVSLPLFLISGSFFCQMEQEDGWIFSLCVQAVFTIKTKQEEMELMAENPRVYSNKCIIIESEAAWNFLFHASSSWSSFVWGKNGRPQHTFCFYVEFVQNLGETASGYLPHTNANLTTNTVCVCVCAFSLNSIKIKVSIKILSKINLQVHTKKPANSPHKSWKCILTTLCTT